MQIRSGQNKIFLMSIADPGRILRAPEAGGRAITVESVRPDDVRTAANRLCGTVSPPILGHREVSMANQLPASMPMATILGITPEMPFSHATQ